MRITTSTHRITSACSGRTRVSHPVLVERTGRATRRAADAQRSTEALVTLRPEDVGGMTVNERLIAAGLMNEFDEALRRRDEARLRDLLAAVYLDESDIVGLIARMLSPDWAVVTETAKRFAGRDWVEATEIIQGVVLPLIDEAGRLTERARVQLAMIKLSSGSIPELRRAARQAAIDWRDVLVAAGLANANWRKVLAAVGYSIPGDPEAQ